MRRPPLFARALLAAFAGAAEAECVAGDLDEEFPSICEAHGQGAGRRWYAWQVVRSVAPLLAMRIRSGELTRMLLGAVLGVALPLLLLDRLWCFVYSQIPLKDGLDRAPGLLAVNVVVVCLCAVVAGYRSSSRASATGTALCSAIAACFAMWASVSATPLGYAALVILGAPAASLLPTAWRRSK